MAQRPTKDDSITTMDTDKIEKLGDLNLLLVEYEGNDAQLRIDAPLLLAEVMRLRQVVAELGGAMYDA